MPVPKFAPKDKNSRIGFIKKNKPDEKFDFQSMSIEELDNVINKIGFEIYNTSVHAINRPDDNDEQTQFETKESEEEKTEE